MSFLENTIFDGFGESELTPAGHPATGDLELCADQRACRGLVRSRCQPVPGVYGMIDDQGQLIYVGKSKALQKRLLSYFSQGDTASKARRIIARTRRLVWELAGHEFSALVRELELIRRWRPRFNVRGQPRRLRSYYLCLGRGPAGHAYLAARPAPRSQWLFGPVRSRWKDAVRTLNDCFQLRDCSDRVPIRFRDQLELFSQQPAPGCLRHELGACLGPCAAACTQASYDERVLAAKRFLEGSDRSLLDRLHADMRSAAAVRQFERAAYLRDLWRELAALADHLESLRDARRRFSFVYPLPDSGGAWRWVFVRHGQVVAASEAPRNRPTTRRCLKLLEETYRSDPDPLHQPREDHDMLLLVNGWFRQFPEEFGRTITPDDAIAMCQVPSPRRSPARAY